MRQSFGLTAFQLKLIAVVAMTLDHVGAYCGDISWIAPYASPLRVIGRIAMPVFLFLFVQSLRHTHSRPRLLLRLYLAGLLVELWDVAGVFFLGDFLGCRETGNIFSTFLYVAILVELLEQLWRWLKTRDRRTGLWVLALAAMVVVPVWLNGWIEARLLGPAHALGIRYLLLLLGLTDAFFPSLLYAEYTPIFLGLGVLLYFAKTKGLQCGVFALFCLACIGMLFYCYGHVDFYLSVRYLTVIVNETQCWMVLALPLLLLYNGQRGRPVKWFFYWYYPLHRTALYTAQALLG